MRLIHKRTGMKCLPVDLISKAHGLVLHDWHAEILAIRCFNHFLIQECYDLANSSSMTSQYIRRRYVDEISASQTPQPFALQEDVKIHIYCSEVPCGDASMELTMAAQNDPTPWASPASSDRDNASQGGLKGRGYFSELGIVRRKPCKYNLVDQQRKTLRQGHSTRRQPPNFVQILLR